MAANSAGHTGSIVIIARQPGDGSASHRLYAVSRPTPSTTGGAPAAKRGCFTGLADCRIIALLTTGLNRIEDDGNPLARDAGMSREADGRCAWVQRGEDVAAAPGSAASANRRPSITGPTAGQMVGCGA